MQREYWAATTTNQDVFRGNSPFIAIAPPYRLLIIGYILLYQIFVPGLSMILHGTSGGLQEARFLVESVYQILLLLPLLFYRPSYGWLHPLIFGPLFILANGIVRDPDRLLAPLLLFSESFHGELSHIALGGWSEDAVAWAVLKAKLIAVVALVVYYCGFFSTLHPRIPRLAFPQPSSLVPKALTVIVFSAVVFVVYMQLQGGINAHMSSWQSGRFEALAGDGPIFVLIQAGLMATLVWVALDGTAYHNPLFWVAVLFTVPVGFFVTGSRSGVFYSFVLFLMVWMIRHKKIPQGRIIALGMAAFILIGTLGAVRKSTFRGEVDWIALADFNLEEMIERTTLDLEARAATSGDLPVIARVPDEVDLLYGQSYVSALLFFIPRALWLDKPRGAGALNGRINFGHTTGGVPVGAVTEAYWNFHIPGVVVIFFLYGLFHRWLAEMFILYAHRPAMWVLYVLTLFSFVPNSISLVVYFQRMIPTVALLYWMGAFSFDKRSSNVYFPVGTSVR
ncbi:MAG: oligosaccharide repeat unit polymerase [Deltaproteobacteria bacterium]|nr:oligosaccharide repeat unit polymerase [Deltaproteobacteria bacterium]